MSLAQLTAWCDDRFGHHAPGIEPEQRTYDIPWIAMDNRNATRDFNWRVETPLPAILAEIAIHAEKHPDWLEISGV
jgi:CDP-paratose 2-epimerase